MKTSVPVEYFLFKLNVLKKVVFITAVASLAAFLLGQKGFSAGFVFGGILAALIFSLLYRYILAMKNFRVPGERKRYIIVRALLIYAIMAIALVIGMKKGLPVFLGTAAGILSLKIAVFLQGFLEKDGR